MVVKNSVSENYDIVESARSFYHNVWHHIQATVFLIPTIMKISNLPQ